MIFLKIIDNVVKAFGFAIENPDSVVSDSQWKDNQSDAYVDNGRIVLGKIDTRTYAQKRADEYPSLGEQLDMQYWDSVNGTNLWQEKIASIKAKYPKEVINEETSSTNNSILHI